MTEHAHMSQPQLRPLGRLMVLIHLIVMKLKRKLSPLIYVLGFFFCFLFFFLLFILYESIAD